MLTQERVSTIIRVIPDPERCISISNRSTIPGESLLAFSWKGVPCIEEKRESGRTLCHHLRKPSFFGSSTLEGEQRASCAGKKGTGPSWFSGETASFISGRLAEDWTLRGGEVARKDGRF